MNGYEEREQLELYGDEIERAQVELDIEQQRETAELHQILQTGGGRYFIWRILSEAGLYSDLSGRDPQATFEAVGKRSLGLSIMNDCLEADPQCLAKLQLDGNRRDKHKEELNNALRE